MIEKRETSIVKGIWKKFLLMLCICTLSISIVTTKPKPAYACETIIQLVLQGAIEEALNEAAMLALQAAVQGLISAVMAPFDSFINGLIDNADDAMRQDLSELWGKWLPALEDMTEQLNVSYIDRTRQQYSMIDSQIQNMVTRAGERKELDIIRDMKPAEQMCVVDTVNPYLLKAYETSSAISVAFENEFFAGGTGSGAMNMIGTVSEDGVDAILNADYNNIINNYLDPNYNGGEMPAGSVSANAGNQYNPAKILYGKDTIDMNNQNSRRDLSTFTRLVLGNPAVDPIPAQVVQTTVGQRAILNRQKYQARLNNYAGAILDAAKDRAGVTAAPEVENLRMSNGVIGGNASANPSYREIRKARRRQMWTPSYLKNLNDLPHTAEQKQIDVYSQKIMDIQDMTRNMERIGMVLSSRLGQRLDNLAELGDGSSSDAKR